MIRRPKNSLIISFCVLAIVVHATILFVVIPKISDRLHTSYNQDEYADGYDQLAANLVNGNGYRMYPETAKTLMREPGYPILLAGIFSLFGKNFTAVKLTNMFMAFVVVWLMTRLARELSSSQVMILGPPLLFLFHPGTLIAESRGGVEVLFTLFLALFMCTLYPAVKFNRSWNYVVSGGVLGLTLLVRSTPLLFPLFLFAYLLVFERQVRKVLILRNVTLMVVAMLVVLSPWTIRNYFLTGKFVPTSSLLGLSAQTGQYILTHHSSDDRRMDRESAQERNDLARELGYLFKDGYYQYFYSSADELKFSNDLLKRVAGEYRRSPKLFLRVIATNLVYFWIGGKTGNSVRMNLVVQLPFLILATMGIVLSARNNQVKQIAPMLVLIIYLVAISVPIIAQARYSVPLIPYVSVLACITLVAAQRVSSGEDRPAENGVRAVYGGPTPSPRLHHLADKKAINSLDL